MQRFGQEQQQNDGSDLIYWIWLSKIPNIGILSRRMLLEKFKNPKKIYEADVEELKQIEGIGEVKGNQIKKARDLAIAEKILMDCEKNKIKIMTMRDEIYPEFAKTLSQMPTHLYYKGNVKKESIGIAIVGARRCSREAKEKAVELAIELSEKSIPIISGMAKGIDSYAHTACLKNGGYTIAVMGNGLDICYPSEHNLLIERIEEQGILLSEYEPGIKPLKAHFPLRNRIIAAWSRQIFVIEAGKRSGALITAQYGEYFEREIYKI